MNWLINIIRKLPVAQYIKPIWKGALKQAVQKCGDWLQVAAKAEIAKDAKSAGGSVAGLIKQWQAKIDAMIPTLPLPAAIDAQLLAACDSAAAKLQGDLLAAAGAGSSGAVADAVDRAFDAFQALLIARIDAL